MSPEEAARRERAIKTLADELRVRGWHVPQAGAWMWVARVRSGPGREIGVIRDGFVWQKGGCYIRPSFAPVDDIPHAADMVDKELSCLKARPHQSRAFSITLEYHLPQRFLGHHY
ncbi:hypothetical protein SMC26_15965 [Actinomadura fulvescens]|uniref:Uncharacterized protein n=1 Tax=Actinomadura fulvescens TaxID=46160 RepID=A0ABN3QW27_9ACTN